MKQLLCIEKVVGREIMDSRGNPTVEAEVVERLQHRLEHPLGPLKQWN